MAVSRHQLEELWVQGVEVDVSPDEDGSIKVFARKLGPNSHQVAVRKANAARVRSKNLLSEKEDSEQKMLLMDDVESKTEDELVEFLAEIEIGNEREKIEQELSEEDEWSEDGYLQSILDSWEDGLLQDWLKGEGERSEESENAFNEMKRFSDAVEEKIEVIKERKRGNIRELGLEDMKEKVLQMYLDREAGIVWLQTFHEYQILYGIEDLETKEKIYDSIEEVREIPIELWTRYLKAFERIKLPPTELKS